MAFASGPVPARAGTLGVMRIVVALGRNALLPRGLDLSVAQQRAAVRAASAVLAALAAECQLVLTLANSPHDDAVEVLDAESDGTLGYVIEQELGDRLAPGRSVVTVVTTTLVSGDDPGFEDPAKLVGPVHGSEEAGRLERLRGWQFHADGPWFRRVVALPAPPAVETVHPVEVLLDLGYVVICGGGDGVPVSVGEHGHEGMEAVVDQDAVSALIAEQLGADLLVIATDVTGVHEGWGTPHAHLLHLIDVVDLDVSSLQAGSMRPKVEAAARFARTGGRAVIGSLSELQDLVEGTAGTQVVDSGVPSRTAHPLTGSVGSRPR